MLGDPGLQREAIPPPRQALVLQPLPIPPGVRGTGPPHNPLSSLHSMGTLQPQGHGAVRTMQPRHRALPSSRREGCTNRGTLRLRREYSIARALCVLSPPCLLTTPCLSKQEVPARAAAGKSEGATTLRRPVARGIPRSLLSHVPRRPVAARCLSDCRHPRYTRDTRGPSNPGYARGLTDCRQPSHPRHPRHPGHPRDPSNNGYAMGPGDLEPAQCGVNRRTRCACSSATSSRTSSGSARGGQRTGSSARLRHPHNRSVTSTTRTDYRGRSARNATLGIGAGSIGNGFRSNGGSGMGRVALSAGQRIVPSHLAPPRDVSQPNAPTCHSHPPKGKAPYPHHWGALLSDPTTGTR